MKSSQFEQTVQPAVAAPIHTAESEQSQRPLEQTLRLLERAATVIRSEEERIKATGLRDQGLRLLRLLGETVEEQRLSFGGRSSK